MDYEEIRSRSYSFLEKYQPSTIIPIPIDDIAERKLKLDIIPIPGLYKLLDMDGFLYGDLSAIAVDEEVMEHSNPVRYRFTIAHEIGHLILHPQLFRASNVQDIGSWQTFVKAIPEPLFNRAEWQAYCFAGLILVPHEYLKQELVKTIETIRTAIKNLPDGLKAHANTSFLRAVVEIEVAKVFEVSSQVISKRIEFDNLNKLFRAL